MLLVRVRAHEIRLLSLDAKLTLTAGSHCCTPFAIALRYAASVRSYASLLSLMLQQYPIFKSCCILVSSETTGRGLAIISDIPGAK